MSKLVVSGGTVRLEGDVTFETVASLFRSFTPHVCEASTDAFIVDFADVKVVNSAALALMIEMSKLALKHQKKTHFKNLPSKLVSLAQVCGVDKMFVV